MGKIAAKIWAEIESELSKMLTDFREHVHNVIEEIRSASKAELQSAVETFDAKIKELENKLENLTKGNN